MLSSAELRSVARARLRDAEILFRGKRYDGAVYLCGYAVEITLKARICTTLHWAGFPQTAAEFRSYNYSSFKTHDLEELLYLSGRNAVRTRYLADWSVVVKWEPESRYQPPGAATKTDARSMIESTRRLMRAL